MMEMACIDRRMAPVMAAVSRNLDRTDPPAGSGARPDSKVSIRPMTHADAGIRGADSLPTPAVALFLFLASSVIE